jgi:hypothetical protein
MRSRGLTAGVQVSPGEVHVQGGVLQLLVTYQELKRGQISPALDEVDREGVPPIPAPE